MIIRTILSRSNTIPSIHHHHHHHSPPSLTRTIPRLTKGERYYQIRTNFEPKRDLNNLIDLTSHKLSKFSDLSTTTRTTTVTRTNCKCYFNSSASMVRTKNDIGTSKEKIFIGNNDRSDPNRKEEEEGEREKFLNKKKEEEEEEEDQQQQKQQPIGILEALRLRYIVPLKVIHQNFSKSSDHRKKDLVGKEEEEVESSQGRKFVEKIQSEGSVRFRSRDDNKNDDDDDDDEGYEKGGKQKTIEFPRSIREGWRAGLEGKRPTDQMIYSSRLRSKASTPIIKIYDCDEKDLEKEKKNEENEKLKRLSRTDEGVLGDSQLSEESNHKKSLLQTYLSLDKRSQRFFSFSLFIWSSCGFVYFGWFV